MALEPADFIAALDAANPTSGDPQSAGDDHLRLLKAVLLATFPNLDEAVVRTPAQINYPVPIGGVIPYFGDPLDLDSDDWGICDGSTYTRTDGGGDIVSPDLRDKTVLGVSPTKTLGSVQSNSQKTSGSAGAHTHGVTVDAGGSHSHSANTAAAGNHSHSGSTTFAGGHSHGGATGYAGIHDHGGATGGRTLQISDIPAHRHQVFVDKTDSNQSYPSSGTSAAKALDGGSGREYTITTASGEPSIGRTSAEGGSTSHNHGISDDGNHRHAIGYESSHYHNLDINSNGNHTHGVTVNAGGSHSHGATTAEAGAHTHSVDVTPPAVYANWIMKL